MGARIILISSIIIKQLKSQFFILILTLSLLQISWRGNTSTFKLFLCNWIMNLLIHKSRFDEPNIFSFMPEKINPLLRL